MAKTQSIGYRRPRSSMAFIVIAREVLRLLRLFFVLYSGLVLGLYSLQGRRLRGCPLAQRSITPICCCGIGSMRVAGCFGEVPALCVECPGFLFFRKPDLGRLPHLGRAREDIEGSCKLADCAQAHHAGSFEVQSFSSRLSHPFKTWSYNQENMPHAALIPDLTSVSSLAASLSGYCETLPTGTQASKAFRRTPSQLSSKHALNRLSVHPVMSTSSRLTSRATAYSDAVGADLGLSMEPVAGVCPDPCMYLRMNHGQTSE